MSKPLLETAKSSLDITSVGVALGAFVEILPAVYTLFGIVWVIIRIYETDTIKGIINKIRK